MIARSRVVVANLVESVEWVVARGAAHVVGILGVVASRVRLDAVGLLQGGQVALELAHE